MIGCFMMVRYTICCVRYIIIIIITPRKIISFTDKEKTTCTDEKLLGYNMSKYVYKIDRNEKATYSKLLHNY